MILFLLNTPLISVGILQAVVSYKMKRIQKRRFLVRISLWTIILAGLIFAQPLYIYLFSNNLTRTEPLSLFDVIQTTGIILTLFIANQAFTKADTLERRVQDLHQELSIQLSERNQRN